LEQLIALAITRPIANPKAPTTALAPSIAQYVGNGRVSVTAGGPGSAPITEKCSSTIEPLIPVQTTPSGEVVIDKNGNLQLDYNMIIPPMLLRYFPSGMLGIGLTAPAGRLPG
jgi:SSS family solute:Na+ symporter